MISHYCLPKLSAVIVKIPIVNGASNAAEGVNTFKQFRVAELASAASFVVIAGARPVPPMPVAPAFASE